MTLKNVIEPEYQGKIQELKKKFVKDMKSSMLANDEMFYRFLKARDFDLEQAEQMLRKHLLWRKEFRIDDIFSETILSEKLLKYCPYSMLGFDKEGSPVYYLVFGNFDYKGIRKSAKFYDRLRTFFKFAEEEELALIKQSKKLGKTVRGINYVLDMHNLSLAVVTDKNVIEEMIKAIRYYQDNYPEHLKTVWVINVSSYFAIMFSIIKKFMAPQVVNKFKIFQEPEEWKPVLLKNIDADVLPAFLGGTRTDPDGDPMCRSFVKHGGQIPPEMYMSNNSSSLSKSKDAKKLVIPRSAFSEIELEVTEPHSWIEWEFETKCRDIGFGLFLKEQEENGEEKLIEIVPLTRMESEEISETGTYECEKPGTYVILFDNSFSWLRSKEVFYKAVVVTPKEHENQTWDV